MTIDTRLAEVDLVKPTYLLVSGKDDLPDVVPLKIGVCVFVGTGTNCKVQLHDESVRQLHCMFIMEDDNVLKVQDWNTGATYLNGQVVSEETEMQSGDMVSVGCYCFTAVLDAEFHKGMAVALLYGGGDFRNAADEVEEVELPTEREIDSCEQSQTDEADLNLVVAGFNVGDELSAEVNDSKQAVASGFTYDIDADLKEDSSDTSSAFDSLPTDLSFAFDSSDAGVGDKSSLLLVEIEQLRFELADRDSQILALNIQLDSTSHAPAADDSDTVKLVSRLEDLLVELQASDYRIQSLEDLLRLSEDATVAERNERAQIERWIREIETRIVQREAESQAEVDSLTLQLRVAKDDVTVLQSQLHSVSVAGVDSDKQIEAVAALSEQVEELRASLKQANEQNRELLERPVQSKDEAELRAKLHESQNELANLRLEASQDRAESARRRAELETLRAELERHLAQASCGTGKEGDSRIRAMRAHLREIHEQEQATKAEQKADGLGGRIANLLSRLR